MCTIGVCCSMPQWLRAGMAIGRRCNIGAKCAQQWFMYTNMYTRYGWEGLGGLGMGCQWIAGLVSRVCLWMGEAGELGMGCQWLAGLVSRVCL